MSTAGSIIVDLLMRTGSFETDTDRAGKKVKKFAKDSSDSAAEVGRAFGTIAGVVVGSMATAGVAVLNWTRQLVDASVELEKFSRLSGTSEQTFQRLAAGAATVGIQNDKLADIFKDTQDKLGDFLSTGGGAMADFFEQIAPKVNLTADAFRNLSGPEVLQKYYNALQKAGVSHADMVFYMEAIASDSALLAPLLANNGEGFRKWGDEAERLGAVLDRETLEAMDKVREQSKQIDLAFQGLKTQVATSLLPQFQELPAFLGSDETRNAFTSIAKWVGSITAEMANGIVMAVNYIGKLMELRGLDAGGALSDASTKALDAQLAKVQERLALERSRDRGSFGLPLTQGQAEAREKRINDLVAERLELQRELTRRYKEEAAAGSTGSPDGNGTTGNGAAPGTFRATAEASKQAKAEAEKMAEAFRSANDQLQRQITLYGDASEISRVNYEIQFGSLQGIDASMQAVIRSSASYLDVLKAMEEVDAYQMEDAQKWADAFDDMLGLTGDAAETTFSQIGAFADQAARNMQTSFADFLFDPFAEGLGGMVKGFTEAIQRMLAEAAAAEIFNLIGTWATGYTGTGSSVINAVGNVMTSGSRAGGGPAAGDGLYRVGEGGRPELFQQGGKSYLIPGDSGSIVPITTGLSSSSAGIGGSVSNQFNTTLHVNSGAGDSQSGAGDQAGQQIQRAFNSMINQWAVQQSRPGGVLYRSGARNG